MQPGVSELWLGNCRADACVTANVNDRLHIFAMIVIKEAEHKILINIACHKSTYVTADLAHSRTDATSAIPGAS